MCIFSCHYYLEGLVLFLVTFLEKIICSKFQDGVKFVFVERNLTRKKITSQYKYMYM